MSSVCALHPSYIVIPQHIKSNTKVLDFLISHFHQIDKDIWRQRITDGKVHWQDGSLISVTTACKPATRVYYYREVEVETKIPFLENILYQDDEIILAFKPHFLPVTPSGNFVNECLINRLRIKTGIRTIAPAHRLDRDTAGIMLMTINPKTRHFYHNLFAQKTITKEYQAIAKLPLTLLTKLQLKAVTSLPKWTVRNCLKKGNPSFTMDIVDGEVNAHSDIELLSIYNDLGLFKLCPITGKTHQLRKHMQSLGMPILHDRFYPNLQAKGPDNYQQPLQLLARRLAFIDPVTGIKHDMSVDPLFIPK